MDKRVYLDTATPKFENDPGPDELTDVVIGNYPDDGIRLKVILVGSDNELLAWADSFKKFVEERGRR